MSWSTILTFVFVGPAEIVEVKLYTTVPKKSNYIASFKPEQSWCQPQNVGWEHSSCDWLFKRVGSGNDKAAAHKVCSTKVAPGS